MNSKYLIPVILVVVALLAALIIPPLLDTAPIQPAPLPSQSSAVAEVAAPAEVSILQAPAPAAPAPAQAALSPTGPIASVDQALSADTAGNEDARIAVLTMIEEATVTYSDEGLVVLGPLLRHSDPEVRAAAIDGVIQLGQTSGAKVLREAARRVGNARDAGKMIEAAEFLELPVFVPSAQ